MSNPVTPDDKITAKASLVEWGVTNIKRNEDGNDSFYCHKPFIFPLDFDVHDLFKAISHANSDEERKEICATFHS